MWAGSVAQSYVSVAKHSAGILLCTPPPPPAPPVAVAAAASTALESGEFVVSVGHTRISRYKF